MLTYNYLIKSFSNYLLECFMKNEKLFLQKNYYSEIFLNLILHFGISIPTKKTKTKLLTINDIYIFYENLLILNDINNVEKSFRMKELSNFIQKLYNEDYFDTFFMDFELNLIKQENFEETIKLELLIDNDKLNIDNFSENLKLIEENNKKEDVNYFFE